MAQIGTFTRNDDGFFGNISTLTLDAKVEKQLGSHVAGVIRANGGGVDWGFGRKRGMGL